MIRICKINRGAFSCVGGFVPILPLLLILLLFSLCLPPNTAAYDLEKSVRRYTLKNGLKVLLMERRLSPTVSLCIRHQVGAVDENDGKTGTAHFLEHMMFKGTKTIGTLDYKKEKPILAAIAKTGRELDLEKMKGAKADAKRIASLSDQRRILQEKAKTLTVSDEIDRLYTENGGTDSNASTGQDLTTYHVSLPSNKIELWARIESDRIKNPVFREFYSERDVVMEERRQRVESDPEGKLYEQFLAAAFIAHPYRRPVLGWPSDMRFLDADYMEEFFKRYHAPNNTVIAIVGDINPAATMRIIEKYFGSILPQKPAPTLTTEEPPQKEERRVNVLFDASPQVAIGYHKPAPPDRDDYTLDMAAEILARGRTSRLYKLLVEKMRIAQSVHTFNGLPGSKYPNLFAIFAKPLNPHTVSEVETAIYSEIEKLKKEPVSEREMEKTRNQMKADYVRDLNSNSGLANKLSYYEALMGDFRYATDYLAMIEKITSNDIMQAAKKYLNRENRTVAAIVGKGQE